MRDARYVYKTIKQINVAVFEFHDNFYSIDLPRDEDIRIALNRLPVGAIYDRTSDIERGMIESFKPAKLIRPYYEDKFVFILTNQIFG